MILTEYNEAETMEMFREEAREEGEAILGELIRILLAEGKYNELEKAASDPAVRKRLYKEYGIQ